MPYNVITLTCSVIALFFGQIVSALTLRYGANYVGGREFVSKRYLRLHDSNINFPQADGTIVPESS